MVVAASGSVNVVLCDTLVVETVENTSVVCVTNDGMEMLADEVLLADEVVNEE